MKALDVTAPVGTLRLVTLPQIQWEPVRTLDEDQDVLTLGWFPTPLASATDGGPTVLGARSEKLVPVIPEPLLDATKAVFDDGTDVVFRTTLPFGLVAVVSVNPQGAADRKPDSYEITRPDFPDKAATGGLQITAEAEGGAKPRPASRRSSPGRRASSSTASTSRAARSSGSRCSRAPAIPPATSRLSSTTTWPRTPRCQ